MVKKQGWKKESQRHKMAGMGISTTPQKFSESSGLWFESNGISKDTIQLVHMIGFDNVDLKVARGYERSEYEKDASQIAILPVSKAKSSIRWLEDEYESSNQARKHKLMNLVKMTRARISKELGMRNPPATKVELHKSRNLFNEFIVIPTSASIMLNWQVRFTAPLFSARLPTTVCNKVQFCTSSIDRTVELPSNTISKPFILPNSNISVIWVLI